MTSQNPFFSKERRIEENRLRLKELYDQYKRTENYYPLFLAYITAFGFYIFDIISALFNGYFPYYYHLITFSTVLTFFYVLVLIWRFFKGVDWQSDFLPYGVYKEYPEEIINDRPELKENEELLHEELFDRYINEIEDLVGNALDIYIKKRNKLKKIWIPMILSLFIYSINIVMYKSLSENIKYNINNQPKTVIMSPKKIIINEIKQKISGSEENKRSDRPHRSKRSVPKGRPASKPSSSKKSDSRK